MKLKYWLMLIVSILPWQDSFAIEKPIPFTEVQSHKTADNCWIIVNKKVYDITKFTKSHENKCDKLKLDDLCGKDASAIWSNKENSDHPHKQRSVMKFESSRIGNFFNSQKAY